MTGDFVFGVIVGIAASVAGYVLAVIHGAHFGD